MAEDNLPSPVRHLVLNYIPSVLQLEILLYLFACRPRFVTLTELVRELKIDAAPLEVQLREMQNRGIASAAPQTAPKAFAYSAAYPEQDTAMIELAAIYPAYRVSIVNLIYSRPAESIRTFADAFRLRKESKETPNE